MIDALALLPDLDAAASADPRSPQATATLHRILNSPPEARRPRRSWRRAAVLAGAVASLTLGAVVAVPGLLGGDKAFATWTADPEVLAPSERAAAADSCRSAQDVPDPTLTAVAERRGVWTTVVLVGDDGWSALCITDSSAGWFSDAMIGSSGVADVASPGPRGIVATDLGTGTMSAGNISLAAGRVGSDVVAVSYASRTDGVVAASVDEGHFALWFPGDELSSAGADLDVTYADGSTAVQRVHL